MSIGAKVPEFCEYTAPSAVTATKAKSPDKSTKFREAREAELKLLSIRANVGAEIEELMVNT
jgi:hypothetical protein